MSDTMYVSTRDIGSMYILYPCIVLQVQLVSDTIYVSARDIGSMYILYPCIVLQVQLVSIIFLLNNINTDPNQSIYLPYE